MLYKSALTTQASGSIDGMTASHNSSGRYLRARVIPTNPNTSDQIAARAAMTNASQRWTNTLTQGQRNGWIAYAAATPVLNRLGDPIILSGQQMYIACQQPRALAIINGITINALTAEPGSPGLGGFTPCSLTYDTGPSADLAYDNTDPWATTTGGILIVQKSGHSVSLAVNYYKGPWQTVGYVQGDTTTPPTSPFNFSFGSWPTGTRRFVRVRASDADGKLSGDQIISIDRPTS